MANKIDQIILANITPEGKKEFQVTNVDLVAVPNETTIVSETTQEVDADGNTTDRTVQTIGIDQNPHFKGTHVNFPINDSLPADQMNTVGAEAWVRRPV